MNTNRNPSAGAGFTLIEVMVAVALGLTTLAFIMSSFMGLYSASASNALYGKMHADIRHALDVISRDLHAARDVVYFYEPAYVGVNVERPSGTDVVLFYLWNNVLYRYRQVGSSWVPEELAKGISSVRFCLYDPSGIQTSDPNAARSVSISIGSQSSTFRYTQRDNLELRVRMRNR